jgi:hypothetical protein
LLGLPYSISDRHVSLNYRNDNSNPEQPISTDTFSLKLSVIAGHMVDRAQTSEDKGPNAFASAMLLDGELLALASLMPADWWDISKLEGREEDDIFQLYHRSKAMLWYNECRLMLHMPFMLKAQHKGENAGMYAYNRTMALKSARMMIRCHKQLRARTEFAAMVCQLIDFQAFTATMLVILDMVERPDLADEAARTPETIEDIELLISVSEVLRTISNETSGRSDVAGQAIKVLDGVSHVLLGCSSPSENGKHPSRVVIPYFGAVTIKPANGKHRCKCCSSADKVPALDLNPMQPIKRDAAPKQMVLQDNVSEPKAFGPDATDNTNSHTLQPTQLPYPADDLISFDSFFGAMKEGDNASQDWAMVDQPRTQQPGSLGPGTNVAGHDNVSDPLLWDETMWQNMLQPDANIDMNGDWNWLMVQ